MFNFDKIPGGRFLLRPFNLRLACLKGKVEYESGFFFSSPDSDDYSLLDEDDRLALLIYAPGMIPRNLNN